MKINDVTRLYLCVSILVLLVATSCSRLVRAPERSFSVWDVMLEESDIPDGWSLLRRDDDPIYRYDDTDAAVMDWFYDGDPSGLTRGGLTIYQHEFLSRAMWHSERMTKDPFNEDSIAATTPVFIPDAFTFQSAFADESLFGCQGTELKGLFPERAICEYFARYDEFVIHFTTEIDFKGQKTIEISELELLLEKIDGNFKRHLANE